MGQKDDFVETICGTDSIINYTQDNSDVLSKTHNIIGSLIIDWNLLHDLNMLLTTCVIFHFVIDCFSTTASKNVYCLLSHIPIVHLKLSPIIIDCLLQFIL